LLAKHNTKSTWKLINEAKHSTKKSGTPVIALKVGNSSNYIFTYKKEIADELIEFYLSVGKIMFDDVNKNKFNMLN